MKNYLQIIVQYKFKFKHIMKTNTTIMMKFNRIASLITGAFVAILAGGCTGQEIQIKSPNILIDVTAKNNTTGEEAVIDYVGAKATVQVIIHLPDREEVLTSDNVTGYLVCNPGDVVDFTYRISSDNEADFSFSQLSNAVTGLGLDKSYSRGEFGFTVQIPELEPGKYPITCKTSYLLKHSRYSVSYSCGATPIETKMVIMIPE